MSRPAQSVRVKPDLELPHEVSGGIRRDDSLEEFFWLVDRMIGDLEAPKSRVFDLHLVARWNAERLAYDVVELTVKQSSEGTPVTSAALRNVRVAEVLQTVLRRKLLDVRGQRVKQEFWTAEARRDPNLREALLLSVARTYAIAKACGAPPLVEVAASLDASQSTATRMVAEARQKGLLD